MPFEDREVRYPPSEEIIEWAKQELERDGNITIIEVVHKILEWAIDQDYVVPANVWLKIAETFDAVDSNGNGVITSDELDAVLDSVDKDESVTDDEPTTDEGDVTPDEEELPSDDEESTAEDDEPKEDIAHFDEINERIAFETAIGLIEGFSIYIQ